MKSREDLQAWMRAGMPLPWPPEPISAEPIWGFEARGEDRLCKWFKGFTLTVWPESKISRFPTAKAHAKCLGCEAQSLSRAPDAPRALDGVEEWMVWHARQNGEVSAGDAQKAFGAVLQWHTVVKLMQGGKGHAYQGKIVHPGDPSHAIRLEQVSQATAERASQ